MKYLASLFLITLTIAVFGQRYEDVNDPNEIKSLLSKENEIEGFGGIDLKLTDIMAERTMLVGGYGGVIVNRAFLLGVAAYGLASQPGFEGVIPGTNDAETLKLYGGYGGILIGGTFFGKEIVHLSMPIMLGAGNLDVSDDNFFDQNFGETNFTIENSAFFVVEPGLQLEFNITSYLRVAGGATYRWLRGLDLENVSDDDLTGWGGVLSIRLGRF